MIETTEITIQDGVVLKTEKLGKDEIEYDTYPPPDKDFKYEDPYVTEEEMRQIALERAQNDENCVDDPEPLANPQRPRKPSSAYFYFMKKHRVRLQQQHPTWPMKRITSSVATLWSKTSPENRAPFIEMAENDSIRYKEQMTQYTKSGSFKKYESIRKRRTKMKHQIRTKEIKENISKVAFEIFANDHGGTEDEKRQLWNETDETIKNEYREKAQNRSKTTVTSRSSRKIKLPARFEDSVTSSCGVKPTKQSSFDNFVRIQQSRDPSLNLESLKSDWNLLTDEEKLKFKTNSTSVVDYKALDDGDLFFDSDQN